MAQSLPKAEIRGDLHHLRQAGALTNEQRDTPVSNARPQKLRVSRNRGDILFIHGLSAAVRS